MFIYLSGYLAFFHYKSYLYCKEKKLTLSDTFTTAFVILEYFYFTVLLLCPDLLCHHLQTQLPLLVCSKNSFVFTTACWPNVCTVKNTMSCRLGVPCSINWIFEKCLWNRSWSMKTSLYSLSSLSFKPLSVSKSCSISDCTVSTWRIQENVQEISVLFLSKDDNRFFSVHIKKHGCGKNTSAMFCNDTVFVQLNKYTCFLQTICTCLHFDRCHITHFLDQCRPVFKQRVFLWGERK